MGQMHLFSSKSSLNLNVQQLLLSVQVILIVIRTSMGAMPLCSRKTSLNRIVRRIVIPGRVRSGVSIHKSYSTIAIQINPSVEVVGVLSRVI